MSLTVNPAALTHFKDVQVSLAGKTEDAKKYVETNLANLGYYDAGIAGKKVWGMAISRIPEARGAIVDNLTRLNEIVTGSANTVGDSGMEYAKIDLHHAQQMDDSFTETSYEHYKPVNASGAKQDPVSKLTEPQAEHGIPQIMGETFSLTSWLNMGKLADEAINLVCGVNPGEWVVQRVVGDWASFAKAADSLNHVGDFYTAFADNIGTDLDTMLQSWQGHASTQAGTYFTSLAESVKNQKGHLDVLAREMITCAEGVAMAADSVKGFLEDLMDRVIALAIETAAGAASAETIFGPLIMGGCAVYTLVKAKRLWKQIGDVIGTAWSVAEALVGVIAGTMGALRDLNNVPLPAGAYQHPTAPEDK